MTPQADLRGVVERRGKVIGWLEPNGKRWVARRPEGKLPAYRRFKSREKARAWLMGNGHLPPQRKPWHATTLRDIGTFVAGGVGLLLVAGLWLYIAATTAIGVLAVAVIVWGMIT